MGTRREVRSTRGGAPSENGDRPRTTDEYDRFERLTRDLLRVPKREIKEREKKSR